ncbi:hypothetical protein [Burkholderia phage FLC9]|nr:hypothetical protein [Burkholderia phage FLC9]
MDLFIRLDQNQTHKDAEAGYEFVSEHLNKYFEEIYLSVKHPYSVLLGIELILRNEALATPRMFDTLLGQRGLSAMESYRIEAIHYGQMTVTGNGRHKHRPFWRIEGDVMMRWSPSRRTPFSFHEAYWMAFLGRYAGTRSNQTELLVFEVLEEYKRRIDPETNRIDPTQPFSEVVFTTLANKGFALGEVIPPDSIVADLAKQVLARIGR